MYIYTGYLAKGDSHHFYKIDTFKTTVQAYTTRNLDHPMPKLEAIPT